MTPIFGGEFLSLIHAQTSLDDSAGSLQTASSLSRVDETGLQNKLYVSLPNLSWQSALGSSKH